MPKWVSALRICKLYHKQDWKCSYCWDYLYLQKEIHIDHIYPKIKWWTLKYENTALACWYCNRVKKDKSVDFINEYIKPYKEWIINDKKDLKEYNQYLMLKDKFNS